MKNFSTPPTGLPDPVGPDDVTSDKPRHWHTVGLTEQKLRAANKKAWMESTSGWSDFFGRFMTSSRAKSP